MMHGLDHDLGAKKDQEIEKNGFPKNPLFCTMTDQQLVVFCHFLMMNYAAKFDPTASFDLMKILNGSDFTKGAQTSPDPVIQRSGHFCKYLKIYEEPMADILSPSGFLDFKDHERFGSRLWDT